MDNTLNPDKLDRVRREACALRHVLNLDTPDRPDAITKLEASSYALTGWLAAVCREITKAPAIECGALWAILDRPTMATDRAAIATAGVTLEVLGNLDPKAARKAYHDAIAGTREAGERRAMQSAADVLAEALAATDPQERARLRTDALNELTRSARDTGAVPLTDAWETYRTARFSRQTAGPDEVLRLDEKKRGGWAAWFNAWLGPRAGLEPGRTMIIGARPGAGKTSLAAALAVDAIEAGVPVLFWQLELSREETLEHLLTQRPEDGSRPWWNDYWTKRVNRELPHDWGELLTVPAVNGPEAYEADTIKEAMLAHHAARARKIHHPVKGLVVVDYAQLLAVRDRRSSTPQHEILTKAASMLAKAAADLDLCLLLLSQLRKADKDAQRQENQSLDETALTGADFGRMAHVAFAFSHAKKATKGAWVECGPRDCEHNDGPQGEGAARLLANLKSRGWAKVLGARPSYTHALWVSNERAIHGGDAHHGLGDDDTPKMKYD